MIATSYGMAVITVGQLALVPLFLHAWGASVYGQWLVLSAVPAYLSLTDVGIGHALGNLLSINVEQGRKQEAQRMLGAALRFQGIFAFGLLLLAAVLVTAFPVAEWLKVQELDSGSAAFVLISLVAYSLLPIQIGCFSGIYRASASYPRFLFLQGHARLLEIVCTAAVLFAGAGMVALSAALLTVRLLWFVAVALDSRRRVAGLEARWSDGSWSDFRSLVPIGAGYFAFPVGNALVNQGVLLLVNHLGGSMAVVILNVCRQTSRIFMQMTSALSASLHPELTVAFARNDRQRLLTLQAGGLAFVSAVGIAFAGFLALAGPALILWWTGKLVVSGMTVSLVALESVTAGIANVSLLPLWAANRLGRLPVFYLVSQTAGLIGVALAYPRLDVAAVGLVFAFGNLFFGMAAWLAVLRLCDCRAREFTAFTFVGLRHFALAALRRPASHSVTKP